MRPPTKPTRHWTRNNTCCALLVAGCLFSLIWVRLNVEPSVPYGLYQLAPVPQSLTHGMLVVLPVPTTVQAFHAGYAPLLKPIAGLPGDTVCSQDHGLSVNGAEFGLVYETVQGESLPHIPEGCQVVPPAHVFL